MDLTNYFPAGMKAGDQLSYPFSVQGNRVMRTVNVVRAEDWHISLKSADFAFTVSTSKNVASTDAPSWVRTGITAMFSQTATANTSAGKLEVAGGFDSTGRAIAILETGYVAAQDADNPATSTLSLGSGFGDYADTTLVFQLVV